MVIINQPEFQYNLRSLFFLITIVAFLLGTYCVHDEPWFQHLVVNVAQFVMIPAAGLIVACYAIQSMRAFRQGLDDGQHKGKS